MTTEVFYLSCIYTRLLIKLHKGSDKMYLDPGFGSMIIQIILAGIATLGAGLFMVRKKIARLFSRKKDKGATEE